MFGHTNRVDSDIGKEAYMNGNCPTGDLIELCRLQMDACREICVLYESKDSDAGVSNMVGSRDFERDESVSIKRPLAPVIVGI